MKGSNLAEGPIPASRVKKILKMRKKMDCSTVARITLETMPELWQGPHIPLVYLIQYGHYDPELAHHHYFGPGKNLPERDGDYIIDLYNKVDEGGNHLVDYLGLYQESLVQGYKQVAEQHEQMTQVCDAERVRELRKKWITEKINAGVSQPSI